MPPMAEVDAMRHLGRSRPKRAHRHTLYVNGRWVITDRCLSGLLWWSAARAVCLDKTVELDGMPLIWTADDARHYLVRSHAPAQWMRGL